MKLVQIFSRLTLAGLLALPAAAVPIDSFNTGLGTISGWGGGAGQSFSTGSQGYDHLVFNFFASGVPVAPGTAYLFSSAYLGTPNNLPTAPNLLGTAVGSGGFYTFNPSVTLAAGTTYWVYMNSAADGIGYGPGNGLYLSFGANGDFGDNNFVPQYSAHFLADGVVAAPEIEPAKGMLPLLFALFLVGAAVRPTGRGSLRPSSPGAAPFHSP